MSQFIIKTPEQIKGIKKSAQLASQTLDYITPYVKEGISTQELNNLVHQFIVDHHAQPAPLNYRGFPKSICTSINSVVCHGISSEKDILKKGDILNIDVTTILNGYYGDTSRMFLIEPVTKKARLLVQRTKNALDKSIAALKPGRFLNECVGKTIEKYIEPFGYSSVRTLTGHGVGLKFHEKPSVFHFDTGQNNIKLKPGMIFTIEPMINASLNYRVKTDPKDGWTIYTVDGALSAQWEHTILITATKGEILSK